MKEYIGQQFLGFALWLNSKHQTQNPKQLLLPLFFLLANVAFANGGPIDGSGVYQTGDLRFLHKTDIQCQAEVLEMKLHNNYTDIRVVYTLHNRSDKAENIDYGFPVDVTDYEHSVSKGLWEKDYVQNLSFWLGKQSLPILTEKADTTFTSISSRKGIFQQPNGEMTIFRKWFCTKFTIQSNETINLEVSYRLKSEYLDWATSKSFFPDFNIRTLAWDFSPAQYWGDGSTHTLQVSIDAAEVYTEDLKIAGLSLAQNGKMYTGNFNAFDFQKAKSLVVQYSPDEVQLLSDYIKKDQVPKAAIKAARASSSLKGDYGPSNAIDGDLSTAWVEGKDGNGVGEWIEFDVDKEGYNYHSAVIIGGYAKSTSSYSKNNRVRKIQVERTITYDNGKTEVMKTVVELKDHLYIPISDERFYAIADLDDVGDMAWKVSKIRFTILEVYPGSHFDDTCISEIMILGWKTDY
ncbi:MAG: discoidin domain-containing protein [Bacteroidia bacterium]